MRYEPIREIFNQCSNNQMRDVFVSEVETEDTDAVARRFCTGQSFTVEKRLNAHGVITYDLVVDGLRQRLSFTPDD